MKNSLKILLLACTSLMAVDVKAAGAARVAAEDAAYRMAQMREAHQAALAAGAGLDPATIGNMGAEITAHAAVPAAAPNDNVTALTGIATAYRTALEGVAGAGAVAAADVRTRLGAAFAAAAAADRAEIAIRDGILATTRGALPAAFLAAADADIPTQVGLLATAHATDEAILADASRDLGLAGLAFAPAAHANIPASILALTAARDAAVTAVAAEGARATAAIDAALTPLFPAAAAPVAALDKARAIATREGDIVGHVNRVLGIAGVAAVGTLPEAINAAAAITNRLRPGVAAVTNIGEVFDVLFSDIADASAAVAATGVAPADASVTAGVTALIAAITDVDTDLVAALTPAGGAGAGPAFGDPRVRVAELVAARDTAEGTVGTRTVERDAAVTALTAVDTDLVAALTPAGGAGAGVAPALGDPRARVAELVAARAAAEATVGTRTGERDAALATLGAVEGTLDGIGVAFGPGANVAAKATEVARVAHDLDVANGLLRGTVAERERMINETEASLIAAGIARPVRRPSLVGVPNLTGMVADLVATRTAATDALTTLSGIVDPVFAGTGHAADTLEHKVTLLTQAAQFRRRILAALNAIPGTATPEAKLTAVIAAYAGGDIN